jgi:hypothetical protein
MELLGKRMDRLARELSPSSLLSASSFFSLTWFKSTRPVFWQESVWSFFALPATEGSTQALAVFA